MATTASITRVGSALTEGESAPIVSTISIATRANAADASATHPDAHGPTDRRGRAHRALGRRPHRHQSGSGDLGGARHGAGAPPHRCAPPIEAVVRDVEKVETAVEPRFQAHFVEALAIPHRTAPPTFLSQAVALPQRRPFDAGNRDGRRRTRRPTPTEPTAVPEEI